MLPREGAYVGRVHIYLSVFDANGTQCRVSSSDAGSHDVDGAARQGGEEPFRYTMNLRLKKGDFTVVVTMRDELSNELGSVGEGREAVASLRSIC